VPPDAGGIVCEQMNRNRWCIGKGFNVVNVVGRRQQRIEFAGLQPSLARDFQLCACRIAAVIEAPVDGFILNAAVYADKTPGEMIMNGRSSAGRHDQREKTKRTVFSTIQRILPDTAAHAACRVRPRTVIRKPTLRTQKPGEGRPQGLDSFRIRANRFRKLTRFVDQGTNLGRVDKKSVSFLIMILVGVTHITHRTPSV